MIKQGLASGIIILLLGMSIIPSSIGLDLKEPYLTSVSGNTLYVGGTGPGNYSKIQDAIDNASYSDTVFVFKGEYHENVYINKSISLIGEDKSMTIVNADDYRDVINISADGVTITGFTLTESDIIWYAGAGIRAESSNYNTIYDNKIVENDYGILLVNSSNNHIYDNTIINNLAHGMRLDFSSNNNISGNSVVYDGGISLYHCSNNSIKENELKYSYSCIYLEDSCDNIIDNNYITGSIWEAVSLWEGSYGNSVIGNTVTDNYDYGIKKWEMVECENIKRHMTSIRAKLRKP